MLNRKWYILGILLALLSACTQLDNYMLGKDNTPQPSALLALKNSKILVENWSVLIARPTQSDVHLKLKPVIKDNIIYAASVNGTVSAIAKNNGDILWSKQVAHGIISGPAVADGFIAVATNKSSVVILRQKDGMKLQRIKLSSDALAAPLIANNRIIIKTIDGYLYAFDSKTFNKLWALEHGSPSLILKASSAPVLMGKFVLVGFSDGKLDAIDIESGRSVWQRSIAYASGSSDVERLIDIDADPIVHGDTVYLASYQGYVGALSLTKGDFIWRKSASVYKNMAFDESSLYLSDSEDILWAIDSKNGQVKWKQTALKSRGLSAPIVSAHRLIIGDRSGFLHVLDAQNGELIARLALGGSIVDMTQVALDRSFYVLSANGKLSSISVS